MPALPVEAPDAAAVAGEVSGGTPACCVGPSVADCVAPFAVSSVGAVSESCARGAVGARSICDGFKRGAIGATAAAVGPGVAIGLSVSGALKGGVALALLVCARGLAGAVEPAGAAAADCTGGACGLLPAGGFGTGIEKSPALDTPTVFVLVTQFAMTGRS